jgi:hypothetical protein
VRSQPRLRCDESRLLLLEARPQQCLVGLDLATQRGCVQLDVFNENLLLAVILGLVLFVPRQQSLLVDRLGRRRLSSASGASRGASPAATCSSASLIASLAASSAAGCSGKAGTTMALKARSWSCSRA